jgi:hypothetical protein
MLFDPGRHEPLGDAPWDAGRARDEIVAIARAAEAAYDPVRRWPLHPDDWEPGTPDVVGGLYLGAAGMVHGLARLAGLYEPQLDLAAIAADLDPAQGDDEGSGASLLAGATGVLLVQHRLAPSPAVADALTAAIAGHVEHPANELLYGAPGTLLAARAIGADALTEATARAMMAARDADGLWTARFGTPARYLGAGHGFAGNVRALGGVEDMTAVLRRHALIEGDLANWPPVPGDDPSRVQWCHGAPGVITSLAGLAPDDPDLTALLVAGGELVWRAGPIAGNAGLCHGTGGNGFAFLALYDRTGDARWYDRAQAFAAHALAQADRDRHSLFTGALGAALLAAACLTGDDRFPGIDDL